MLSVAKYIKNAQIAVSHITYLWDEWHVNDYFMEIDEGQFARLDTLSDAANLALAIGCGEWICHRFFTLDNDPTPLHYLEAAWAAIIYPGYCKYIETDDDEWRGPVRGPLNVMISILNDGIHCRDLDDPESVRACWMYNLAKHVLPHGDLFDDWFEACTVRFEKDHPWVENDDIWEEGPLFGIPVPREAIDPSFPYDPNASPGLLDQYLKNLNPSQNPFLPITIDDLEVPSFRGKLYKYSASNWDI